MTKHVMMRITVVKRERESTFSRNVWFFFFFHCCVVPSIWRHTERNTHLFDLRDPVCALSISLALQRVEWHSNRWKIFYASWKWINKDLFARYQHKKHGKRVYVIDAHHTHVNVNWSVIQTKFVRDCDFFYISVKQLAPSSIGTMKRLIWKTVNKKVTTMEERAYLRSCERFFSQKKPYFVGGERNFTQKW